MSEVLGHIADQVIVVPDLGPAALVAQDLDLSALGQALIDLVVGAGAHAEVDPVGVDVTDLGVILLGLGGSGIVAVAGIVGIFKGVAVIAGVAVVAGGAGAALVIAGVAGIAVGRGGDHGRGRRLLNRHRRTSLPSIPPSSGR